MIKPDVNTMKKAIERFAASASSLAGSTSALVLAVFVVILWAASGPILHFSNSWQLIITTGTSIATFLMVFLIQKAQNKDALAIQIKLNELIASSKLASNMIVNVEDLTEEELKVLNRYYSKLADITRNDPEKKIAHETKLEQANLEK